MDEARYLVESRTAAADARRPRFGLLDDGAAKESPLRRGMLKVSDAGGITEKSSVIDGRRARLDAVGVSKKKLVSTALPCVLSDCVIVSRFRRLRRDAVVLTECCECSELLECTVKLSGLPLRASAENCDDDDRLENCVETARRVVSIGEETLEHDSDDFGESVGSGATSSSSSFDASSALFAFINRCDSRKEDESGDDEDGANACIKSREENDEDGEPLTRIRSGDIVTGDDGLSGLRSNSIFGIVTTMAGFVVGLMRRPFCETTVVTVFTDGAFPVFSIELSDKKSRTVVD